MHRRVLLAALGALLLSACAATASVRVALPDVAGVLFPQQTQCVVRFGNASAVGDASPFFATRLEASEPPSVPACEATSRLCLEIVLTSAFEWDPFALRSFESRLSVASKTFDPVVVAAAQGLVLPVIEGDASAALIPQDGVLSGAPQTLWRFNVPATTTPVDAAIDLLFRLRQRSQLRAARDQLIVHVAIASDGNSTSSTRVEAYTVYGSARASRRVTQLSSKQLRLDLAIVRNASLAAVVLPDASPLMPVESGRSRSWRVVDGDCLAGLSLLLNCSATEDVNTGVCSYETSKAALPVLLRSSYGMTTTWYEAFMASRDVGQSMSLGIWLNASYTEVMERNEGVDSFVTQRQWWYAVKALSTLAARRCPFGPLSAVDLGADKMLQLAGPTPFTLQLLLADTQTFIGWFLLKFGTGVPRMVTNTISHMNTTDEIARVIKAPMASLGPLQVSVTKTFDDTTTSWHLRAVISDLVLPSFALIFVTDKSSSQFEDVSESTASASPGGFTSLVVAAINGSQIELEDLCDSCLNELKACRHDAMCRRVVLPCVMRSLTNVAASDGVMDPASGSYRAQFLTSLRSQCMSTASVASWDPIRRALLCVSNYNCDVDGSRNAIQDEKTYVQFSNGSLSIAVPRGEANTTALVISHGGASFRFNAPIDRLPQFLQSFVLQNAAAVGVDAHDYASDASMVLLHITFSDSLSLNPSFAGTPGLVPVSEVQPTGYLQFTSAANFSVAKMIQVMQTVTVDPVEPAVLNHPWRLQPICLSASAQLYGCSPSDVAANVCLYDNATSPLAECFRGVFPRSFFANLAQQPLRYSVTVSSDVTRCAQTATALPSGSSAANRSSVDLALARFSQSGCPFGPLDLVRNGSMVTLSTSAFRHTIRIRANEFRIQLVFALGSFAVGSAVLNETSNISQTLSPVLLPIGVSIDEASATLDGSEWTLEMSYRDVVAADFSVKVAAGSVPDTSVVDQAVLRPVTRFTVVPHASGLMVPSSAATNATGDWTNSTSGSGSG